MISELLGPWVPRAVVDYVKQLLSRGPKYLDLGCGNGDVTTKIAEAIGAQEVYGVDVDEGSLAKAREKGLAVFKRDLDREPLPFEDESFDFVTSVEVIEHLRNPRFMIREVFRVLRAGGVFLVETPNAAGCSCRFVADQLKLALLTDRLSMPSGPIIEAREATGFDLVSLGQEMASAGFDVLKVFGFSNAPQWLPLLTVVVEDAEGSLSTAPHIMAIATKR
jgi:SAM-dependent methyltransferase